MTKAEFINRVSKKVKLSKAHTGRVMDAMLDELTGVLKRKDSIALTGFGTFLVSKRKARKVPTATTRLVTVRVINGQGSMTQRTVDLTTMIRQW